VAGHPPARRSFLPAVVATVAIASALPLAGPAVALAADDERPNVLLIVTDDQRPWGALRTQDAVRDRIRGRGTTFRHAFTTTPICCPARASLLTGLYTHNHGVFTNDEPFGSLAKVDAMTFASALHEDGYTTGLFGKYLNLWPNEVSPTGFDRFALTPRVTYEPALWNVNGTIRQIDAYPTRFIRRQTLRFLDSASDVAAPWFAYVAPMAPHVPATPERRYADLPVGRLRLSPAMLESDRSDKPPFVQEETPRPSSYLRSLRDRQLRSLASVDDLVDSAIDRLRALGELRNTIVIYTSDNGFLWGEHGLRGKAVPYLPSVRVPLFIRWDGHLDGGTVDERIVTLLDLAPTILNAAGTAPPHQMDGIDLFAGGERTRVLLEYFSWEMAPAPSWAAVMTPSAEYVEYYDDLGAVTFREYYDLSQDRHQLVNLLGDADVGNDPDVSSLASELAALRVCTGDSCVA